MQIDRAGRDSAAVPLLGGDSDTEVDNAIDLRVMESAEGRFPPLGDDEDCASRCRKCVGISVCVCALCTAGLVLGLMVYGAIEFDDSRGGYASGFS